MNNLSALVQALGMVDSAILQRLAADQYRTLYAAEDWLFRLLPESQTTQVFTIQHESAFLEDFLIDADQFWQQGLDGKIQSGIWTEQRGDTILHLEATAAYAQNTCYLLIHNVESHYAQQQKTLQIAREHLLSNEKIVAQHDDIFNRISAIMQSVAGSKDPLKPLQNTLQQSDIGIAVLDQQLNLLSANSALHQLFNAIDIKKKDSPEKVILRLFENQYPEYQRVIREGSAWSGELYWLNSPNPGIWFKVSIHPIFSDSHQKRLWLLSVSDITQLRFLVKRNEQLTHYDLLTDLPNRHFFWQQLERYINKKRAFYLLYIEIKQFKKVNELHGHLIGDQVIKQLSGRLKSAIGDADILARLGGTEFALLIHSEHQLNQLSEADQQYCHQLADELIAECNLPFILDSGQQCNIGLNIGAVACPADADSPENLMRYADLAVFAAKRNAKSSVLFYSKALKDASRKRLELEEALRKALDKQELELFFQPIYNLRSQQVSKAEVLLRWNRPNVGMVPPDDFIPLAEQTGLIIPIGKWVIEQTCIKMAQLQKENQQLTLCINLSPRQVNDRLLFDFIKDCVEKYHIQPKQLELELTEGVLIDNFSKVQHLLNQVRGLGITVSIDDFGTGYSSLAYLQKLSIDRLKIDRSFITDLNENENDRALVLAVIAMAHSLKLDVIAEGVETQQQCDFLVSNQCHTAQGFLFSRPLPFSQFSQLLHTQKNT